MSEGNKPKLAVFKFSSCDGCQLTLLNAEDELLEICGALEVALFAEATSKAMPGPYDVALVEGSITTEEDIERIRQVRKDSKFVVTIGACATAGGIQALRNWAEVEEYEAQVYPSPEYIQVLAKSTPVSVHIPVDFELHGCPIHKGQLIEVITSLLAGRIPHLPMHSVCMECKALGTVCGLIVHGPPCLGPVTRSGCGALCPSFHRGCYGCFGPLPKANVDALVAQMRAANMKDERILNILRGFTGYAEEFRATAEKLEATL